MKYFDMLGILRRLEESVGGTWYVARDSRGKFGGEAAPGATIMSDENTEPIARLSGYLMPLDGNAAFICHARADILALIAEVVRVNAVVQAIGAESIKPGNEALFDAFERATDGAAASFYPTDKAVSRLLAPSFEKPSP